MKKYNLVFEEPKVGTFEGEREVNILETPRIGEHINLDGSIFEVVDVIYEQDQQDFIGKIYIKPIDTKSKYLTQLYKKVNE